MSRRHLTSGGLVSVVLMFLAVPGLSAQSSDKPPPFVAARLGANFQATEPDSGVSLGGGGSVAFFLSRRWAVELEAWIPAYISGLVPTLRPEQGEFRDLLFGVSALRQFGGDGVRPYALAGIALSRTEYRTSIEHWASTNGYIQAGGGLMVPLSNRLAVAPEFRLSITPFSAILRPSVAFIYSLR